MAEPELSGAPEPSVVDRLATLLAAPGRQIDEGLRRMKASVADLFGFPPEALDAALATAPFPGMIRFGPVGLAGVNPAIDPRALAQGRAHLFRSAMQGVPQGGSEPPIPLQQSLRSLRSFPSMGQGPFPGVFDTRVFMPEVSPAAIYGEAVAPPFQGLLAERLAIPGHAPELRSLIDVLTRSRALR